MRYKFDDETAGLVYRALGVLIGIDKQPLSENEIRRLDALRKVIAGYWQMECEVYSSMVDDELKEGRKQS